MFDCFHFSDKCCKVIGSNVKTLYWIKPPRLGFCVLNFLPIHSSFLSREKLPQKGQKSKAEKFPKLQFLSDKIDQNTIFSQLPSAKMLFLYNSTSYLLSFWRFVFCQFLSWENIWEDWEKIKTQNPTPR